MKKLLLPFLFIWVGISCTKEPNSDTPVNADEVKTDEVRLVVNLPSSVSTTKATDSYVVSGSFKDPNSWIENGSLKLSPITEGMYAGKLGIKIPLSAFEGDLEFKIQRNGKWDFVEKSNTCDEISNRKIERTQAGKTVEINVANFRNTGTCPS